MKPAAIVLRPQGEKPIRIPDSPDGRRIIHLALKLAQSVAEQDAA